MDRTNQYEQHKLQRMQMRRRSLYRKWQDVTVDEMKGFVATILNMGILQLSNLKDYWSTDDTCDVPFFRYAFALTML